MSGRLIHPLRNERHMATLRFDTRFVAIGDGSRKRANLRGCE